MSFPYNAGGSGAGWQDAGAPQRHRFTDPGLIVALVLVILFAGLAALLLQANSSSLQIALNGASATGIIQHLQPCDNGEDQPTVAFLDKQGQEHVGTSSGCDIYILNDSLTIHYSTAHPDSGILTDREVGGVYTFAIIGALCGLASLICLGYLAVKITRLRGFGNLSLTTFLTAFVLIALLAGTLFTIHPGTQRKNTYRHYQIGETANAQGGWAVTLKSVQGAREGVSSTACVVYDVILRNTSSQTQPAAHGSFKLYDTSGQELNPCLSDTASLSGSIPPGGLLEGQLASERPPNAHLFWLAFSSYDSDSAETVWDIPGSAASLPDLTDHQIGETVAVQGLWAVTITSAQPTTTGVQNPPQPGETCLLLQVTVKNISAQQLTLRPSMFTLYNAQGILLTFPCLVAPALQERPLSPGETDQGVIAYLVPTSNHQFQVAFQSTSDCALSCQGWEVWTISVG